MFTKNRNVYQISKFLPKIEMFTKYRIFFTKNLNFYEKSTSLPKTEIFTKNRNFVDEWKCSKDSIFRMFKSFDFWQKFLI